MPLLAGTYFVPQRMMLLQDNRCKQLKSYVIPTVRLKEEMAAGVAIVRQNGICWSVTVVSSEALSAGSRWPFPRALESRNSIVST